MELHYLGMGKRFYGRRFLPCYQRYRWEFQIILEGRCILRRSEGGREEDLRIEADAAAIGVLCGPESAHTWLGREGDECEVAVFQYHQIAPDLSRQIGLSGRRMIALTEADRSRVQAWLQRCVSESSATPERLRRVHQIVRTELELLFLQGPAGRIASGSDLAARQVAEAMEWYRANLEWLPGIADVGKAMHLSPAHLRRIFHRVKGASPQEIMADIRFERALQWMRDSRVTLEVIAEQVGFGSASAFSRAFKKRFSQSPADYRKTMG